MARGKLGQGLLRALVHVASATLQTPTHLRGDVYASFSPRQRADQRAKWTERNSGANAAQSHEEFAGSLSTLIAEYGKLSS